MGKFVIQPHGRLQEWVAEERGYFTEEGLDYEFATEWFAGDTRTTSAVQSTDEASHELKSGALEDMEQGRACDVSGACHWAVNEAATKASGKMWGNAYSVSPAGILRRSGLGVPAPPGPRGSSGRRRLPLRQPLFGDPGLVVGPGPVRDHHDLRRLPLRPGAAHDARRGAGGERLRPAVLTCWSSSASASCWTPRS